MTAFLDEVVGKGGNVEVVHSDNGTEWVNKVFLRMTTLLHIKHTRSLPYHPQGNAVIESSHFRIKSILRASLGRQPTVLWTEGVKGAVKTLNSLQHSQTSLLPNFLYYGRETSLPLASLVAPPRPENKPLTPQERVVQLAQQSVKYLVPSGLGAGFY
jgi:transposase InsO family protein